MVVAAKPRLGKLATARKVERKQTAAATLANSNLLKAMKELSKSHRILPSARTWIDPRYVDTRDAKVQRPNPHIAALVQKEGA